MQEKFWNFIKYVVFIIFAGALILYGLYRVNKVEHKKPGIPSQIGK